MSISVAIHLSVKSAFAEGLGDQWLVSTVRCYEQLAAGGTVEPVWASTQYTVHQCGEFLSSKFLCCLLSADSDGVQMTNE